ncbi:MAG: hypothetical protein LOY03_08775 [Cyclobacteriaceae bacterium]|nr:hypothetical protein [Cyclobacteriaceae bacterium]
MLDVGLYFCYTLLIVAAVSAIVLPLIKAAAEPRTLVRSLIGVAALLVIFGIAFALSDSSVKPTWLVQGIGETSSKVIGAGLITFYTVLVLAFVGLIFSEINKALK